MPYFCHQVSYTKEAWAKLMENPQDRLEAVRAPIEKLGGKLQISFFAFGRVRRDRDYRDARQHYRCGSIHGICRRRSGAKHPDHAADDRRASGGSAA